MYDVLHKNAYIMYVDSSRIFAVLNCLFNIHNDNAFVYIHYALTSLRNPMGGTSPVVRSTPVSGCTWRTATCPVLRGLDVIFC